MAEFQPPRGGRGSQSDGKSPVPSAFWQPPEKVETSPYWRFKKGNIFLGWSRGVPVGVGDDRHLLTVAGARAGKSSTLLIPNLQLYDGSILVLDPKGELATATAAFRADAFRHPVHVLDPWGVATVPEALRASFDPLRELKIDRPNGALAEMADDAALMAEALIEDGGGGKDTHWINAARDFVRAMILWQACLPDDDATLAELPSLIADCMQSGDEPSSETNHLANMYAFEGEGVPAYVLDIIRNAGRGLLGTPGAERNSILSTARNQLGFLESLPLQNSLARSSFRLSDLKSGGPITVYLCLPASRMGTHAKWVRLFLNMAIAALERDKFEPERPVLFMLEEFAALGHMRALEQAAAYMAGFDVKLWTVLQDLTQLKRHYEQGWETFLGNAGVVTAFGNNDQTTLDYLSRRLGDTFVYLSENAQQGSSASASGSPTVRENFQKVPLIAPDELARHFGRRAATCLALPADGPPIALDRRIFETAQELIAAIWSGAHG